MVDVDIDKFILISQVYVDKNDKKDISKGVSDVLEYADSLNKIYDIHAAEQKIYLNNEVNSFTNIFRDQSLTINFNRSILNDNAPDLVEGFFHVPSMIKRK